MLIGRSFYVEAEHRNPLSQFAVASTRTFRKHAVNGRSAAG
jgi:hypothetical protein